MYDYNKFVEGLAGYQAQFGEYSGPQATLYLFSPRVLPTQILRPYIYNFTPEFMNKVLNGPTTMQEAVAPNQYGKDPCVTQAILPDINGTLLNTSQLSSTWSFVLYIDDCPITGGIRYAAPSPSTRLIACGYVTGIDILQAEEPVNPVTQTINDRAVLVFTHSTTALAACSIGNLGAGNMFTVSHDNDIIPPIVGTMAANGETLYLGTPGDIVSNTDMSIQSEPTTAFGSMVVQASDNSEDGYKSVSGVLKSAKHQLNNIMHTMDSAMSYVGDDVHIRSSILPIDSSSDEIRFHTNVASNMPGSNCQLPKTIIGLDTTKPITMRHLVSIFPNINIYPCKVPVVGEWGVSPQDTMTRKNQMCALVSATISSIMPGVGLSNINFRYNSWTKADKFMAAPEGVWQFYEPIGTLVQMSSREKARVVDEFATILKNELFPILRTVNGEFDLMACCNLTGEILLDLHFLSDMRESQDPFASFYETNGRIAGIINPMVANFNIISSNVGSLTGLSKEVVDHKLGCRAYLMQNNQTLDELNNQPLYGDDPTWDQHPPFQGGSTITEPTQTITSSFSNYTL